MTTKTHGAHGWPLVPSTRFPGERMLAYPECGETDYIMSSIGAGFGSGPGGRHRMGDNFIPTIECRSCGCRDMGGERMHVVNGGSTPLAIAGRLDAGEPESDMERDRR